MNGIIFLNKPEGITSFKALEAIKQKMNMRRVGHAGTLDSFAEGLLIVLTGSFTRLVNIFQEEEKEYLAQIEFGRTTTTLDPGGDFQGEAILPEIAQLKKMLLCFNGEQNQIPPIYSAIQVKGRRASELARQGKSFELKPRHIKISELELLEYNPPFALLRIVCSKGTYIRALARDLALTCQSLAYVKKLKRIRVGPFSLKEAVLAQDFYPPRDLIPAFKVLTRLKNINFLKVRPEYASGILQGKKIELFFFENELAYGLNAVFNADGNLLALIKKEGQNCKYVSVFP